MANISDNNVILRLQLESKSFKKEVKETSKNVSTLEKNVKSLGDSLENDMKEKQIKVVKDEIGKLKEGVKELTTEQKKQTTETKKQGTELGKLIKDFKVFGVSINDIKDKFGSLKKGANETSTSLKGAAKSGKLLSKVFKASVIGLFVVAITSLVAIFSKFQPAVDLVNKSMSALSAAFNVVIDRVATFTLGLGKFISGDFSAGVDQMAESTKGFGKELTKAAKAGFKLEEAAIKLRAAQRKLREDYSKTRGDIEKNRIEADRETTDGVKGLERRKKAIQSAIDLSVKLEEQRIKVAKEALRIKKELTEKNKVGGKAREQDLERETELIVELNDVVEDSNSQRAADLLTLQSIEKEGIELSKKNAEERKKIAEERKKELQEQEEITRKVLENIEDLEIALIGKSEERARASLKTAAKRTIANLVGTPEEIAKQTELIMRILKQKLEEVKDVENVQLLESDFLTKQVKSVTDTTEPVKLNISDSIEFDDKDGFAEKLGKLFDPKSENNKKLREGLSALQDITGSIFAADDKATESRLNNIDAQVKAADERIKRAVEGGKEGSEEVIAIEEAKIERLEKARQRSLEQQQKQAKIESALAATSSLVNAVPLVIDLFKKGGLVGGLAGIASVIASIATLRAAVQKNTPTFHDGTSYADETGTATGGKLKSNEFMAKLEKGEMVIPKGDSARLRHLGVKHTDILKLAESTRDKGVVTLGGNLDDSQQIIETNNRIISQNEKLLRYIKNLKTEVKIDERGLSIRQMKLQSKIKKRR